MMNRKTHNLPISIELPEGFLESEEKWGHMISSKMKKVWAVELDLLNEFIRVCEKHNLNYYLGYGSLLGAIRHHGFIPWDDDIDVLMFRKDFEKLCQIAPTAFKHPYFFQTPISEKGNNFFRTHPQLRNSLTTGSIKEDIHKNINRGIFIDIFILDNIPLEKIDEHRMELNKIRGIGRFITSPSLDCAFSKKIKRLLKYVLYNILGGPIWAYKKFHQIASKYRDEECDLVAFNGILYEDGSIWPKKYWEEYVMVDFEFLKVRVPKEYDKILTIRYGNYMTPDKVNFQYHGQLLLNPEKPYHEVCNSVN